MQKLVETFFETEGFEGSIIEVVFSELILIKKYLFLFNVII